MSMLETSSSCSFTNHCKNEWDVWSFSLPARSTRSLICFVTVSSQSSESFTASSALAKRDLDRKSTRLNSSHRTISYAVFCLKKKNRPRPNDFRFYMMCAKQKPHALLHAEHLESICTPARSGPGTAIAAIKLSHTASLKQARQ